MDKVISDLFSFIKSSPNAFFAVDTLKKRLASAGFAELPDDGTAAPDGKYFVTRNGSSLIAFVKNPASCGFSIVASHADSPAFRLKRTAESAGAYIRLEVERYGGMIYYTWLDRPLSLAGRVFVRTESGIVSKLVNIDRDLCLMPSVAIHLNRGVNEDAKFNPSVDLLPLYAGLEEKGSLEKLIAEAAGVAAEDIVAHDLFLYNREEGRLFGSHGEFMLCPRLDDLGCVYASLAGFLDADCEKTCPVLAVFDNEEVGSETKQGAASTFLADTLRRIAGDAYASFLQNSFMVSADNAHAKHPSHPELSDADHAPVLNGGLVIKFNANQRYATDGLSDAVFRTICKKAGADVQTYCNRADMPGGSTLGSIADTRVSIPTVDIGLPQLAMHAANETAGTKDLVGMIAALKAFYSTPLLRNGEGFDF